MSFKNTTKPPLDGFLRQFLIKTKKRLIIIEDSRDNNNNRKNGRNCGCHEVTYNTDNRDYLFYTVVLVVCVVV